ncbi:MAG: hypothetical protein ACK5NC_07785 [Vibrio sp.]
MMKVVFTAVVSVVLMCGVVLGLNYFGMPLTKLLTFNNGVATDDVAINIQEQLEVKDILIPVNLERRQKLLLIEVALYCNAGDKPLLMTKVAKIKNAMLQKFSVKPESYFLSQTFVSTLQADIQDVLVKDPEFGINKVLVTKAVYQ